ncbi:MAG: beta-N-acetylhexosaminidase [Clostridia bacterium]
MQALSLREKIGQRLVVGFPAFKLTEEYRALVRDYKVANVILFAENIESAEQLRALCAEIQTLVQKETGHPAFITIDQEGGVVSRLSERFAAVVPSAMAIAATGDPHNAYLAGKITGTELAALGVNFDLAPDMDVNSNPQNPVIGVRSYGDTPQTVCAYGTEMIRGLQEGGVLATAKHFPGHGDTAVDSHLSLPMVDKSEAELEALELLPFRAAIEAGVAAIMTTHILFPQIEKENVPATMSRTLMTGLLRQKLGFRGLIVSDCMMMNAIQGYYGTVNGCVAAVKAGVDLVFTSHSVDFAREACDALMRQAESGELSMEELDASALRILHYKHMVDALPRPPLALVGCDAHREFVRKAMEQAVTQVSNPLAPCPPLGANPLFLGCYPFRPTLASSPEMKELSFPLFLAQHLGGEGLPTPTDPTQEEISALVQKAQGHSSIVLGTYNGHIKQGQLALAQALAQTGLPLVCVALRNPYDLRNLPKSVYTLAVFEYDRNSLIAVADVLSGKLIPTGKLSVTL